MMAPNPGETRDRIAVILLCSLTLLIIGGIAGGAIAARIPNDSQTLLGVIVGGLMLFARECLQAIRAFWQDTRTGKLTDALAGSTPPTDPIPADAGEAARVVADRADDAATRIEREVKT